jgi:Xaa-Pro dipeptidase
VVFVARGQERLEDRMTERVTAADGSTPSRWSGPSGGPAWADLYRDHLERVTRAAADALALHARGDAPSFRGIVLHAGTRQAYHADDQHVPFRSVPHFARFAPIPGPDHLVLFEPGEPLRVVRVVPADYWEDALPLPDHPLDDHSMRSRIDIREAPSVEAAAVVLGDVSRCAYVGDSPALAARLGLSEAAVEPPGLMAPLDWSRAFKTAYEVECIRQATRRAAAGHAAARRGFEARASEREIHAAYLAASDQLDGETPYSNIIAWDECSSVLHYQAKRSSRPEPGDTFLIDAGAVVHGYASDITRTYARESAHPVFLEALDRMEVLQQQLAAGVHAGASYEDLHGEAVRGVGTVLCELGVLRVGAEEVYDRGLALPFLPHGLGHHLGLQVHDVGGQQVTPEGLQRPPSAAYPTLRTTRDLETGHVVTIEPGLYFIPMLLEPQRGGPDADAFDWSLVDALIPCGGIRIEDDVHVTETGPENLTRPHVPGHRDAPVGGPA